MATQPSNLPVPSESPRDLKFNAGKIDEFVTSLVNTYVDRFGNEHYTIEGLRWLAQQAIAQFGWILIDSFQDGADITLPNQALRDEDTGEYYRWDGALPKHVDAGSTPATSGGVGVGAWVGIGDASLRAMLATSAGAGMIGALDSDGNTTTVQQAMNHYRMMTIKDRLDEELSVKAFGAVGNGIVDDTTAIQQAINVCIANGATLYFPKGKYKVTSTLIATSTLSMRGDSMAAYDGATTIFCGAPSILLIDFQGPENFIEKIIFLGYEPINADNVNGYGQGATCTGLKFLRSNGAKDIDSVLSFCGLVSFQTGVKPTGSNLKITDSIFTAVRFPIDLYASASAPDDFRGHVIDNVRFHKCGGNTTTTDSVCIRATGTLKNVQLTRLFADNGCHRLFYGSLAEGAIIDGVVVRQMDGDCITVVNTGITPSAAYQTYSISNVSYQTPGSLAINGGWCVTLIDAPGGMVTDIVSAYTRRGVVVASNSPDLIISDINGRNINVGYATDGAVYDGVSLTNNSINCSVDNVKIRNTLSPSQARSAVYVDSTSLAHVANISSTNCVTTFDGAGQIRGERYNANSAPSIGWGSVAPTTGTYIAGSIVWTNTPTAGGGKGWRCITSGTPGVWEGF